MSADDSDFDTEFTDVQDETPLIADYREHHSDSNVHFVVELLPGKMEELLATPGGLEAKFKLQSKLTTSMYCPMQTLPINNSNVEAPTWPI